MAHSETQHGSRSTFANGMMRFGQVAVVLGLVALLFSPAFVAFGVGGTAYYGLGGMVLGAVGYGLGRLLGRSVAPDVTPQPDE